MFIHFNNYNFPVLSANPMGRSLDTTLNYLTFTVYVVFSVSYIVSLIYGHYNIRGKYRDQFWEVLVDIKEAYSRNTTEDVLDMDDDEDDGHWCFWTGRFVDPQFQAVNCSVCGEYIVSHTDKAPKCVCKSNINNSYFVNNSSVSECFGPEVLSESSLDTYNWVSVTTEDYVHKYGEPRFPRTPPPL
jgi:hypothetical protein